MTGMLGHVACRERRAPGMTDQNHFVSTDLLSHRFQIVDQALEGVIAHVRQKTRQAAARLIEQKYPKAFLCQAAVELLIKGTLAYTWAAVKIDHRVGLHCHPRRRVKLAVG